MSHDYLWRDVEGEIRFRVICCYCHSGIYYHARQKIPTKREADMGTLAALASSNASHPKSKNSVTGPGVITVVGANRTSRSMGQSASAELTGIRRQHIGFYQTPTRYAKAVARFLG